MPVVVEDRFDREPITGLGVVQLRDAETGASRWVDTDNAGLRRAQNLAIAQARQQREDIFQQTQAYPIRLTTDGRHIDQIIRQSRENKTAGDAYVR